MAHQLTLFSGLNRTKKTRKPLEGPHFDCCRAWCALWRETRPGAWAWTPRDYKGIKQALALADGDVAAVLDRMKRLLVDPPNRWYAQEASPRLLASRWNELGHSIKVRPLAERNLDTLRLAAMEL